MESQIYGYIARVFKCCILNLDQDQIPQNNDLNISNAVLRISGLLIYLENKNKNEFLKNYQKKIMTLNKIFGYIFINSIQLEASNIWAAFFMCRTLMKHISCHKSISKSQDDISCALAMYPIVWDLLYLVGSSLYSSSTVEPAVWKRPSPTLYLDTSINQSIHYSRGKAVFLSFFLI